MRTKKKKLWAKYLQDKNLGNIITKSKLTVLNVLLMPQLKPE